MKSLIEKNLKHLLEKNHSNHNDFLLKTAVNNLNTKKLIIISWIKFSWKTEFISKLIKKTKSENSVFYFNKILDNLNKIKNSNDLNQMLEDFIENFSIPKIIILQDINKVEWIKNLLWELFKEKNYKIIIVWNNIQIDSVKNIELFPTKYNNDLDNTLKYWQFEKISIIKNEYFKNFYLENIKDSIISNDIIYTYSIKNYYQYYSTISYIAWINKFISLRELHRNLKKNNISISLITLIDYINSSINSKLIRRIYTFDLKQEKEITWKAKYFFTDLWIRNSIYWEKLNKDLLIDNLVFIELIKNWYEVNSWLNWKFEFSFIATKNNKSIYIHITKEEEENEIRKEVKKLFKIWNNNEKYLIIDNLEDYNLKKINLDWVIIKNLSNFLNKI